jgi:hypothetical protein
MEQPAHQPRAGFRGVGGNGEDRRHAFAVLPRRFEISMTPHCRARPPDSCLG